MRPGNPQVPVKFPESPLVQLGKYGLQIDGSDLRAAEGRGHPKPAWRMAEIAACVERVWQNLEIMRYLREAFLAKWNVPQLGAIPFNIVGLAAFAVLGFGEPAFWLLGAGAEAAFSSRWRRTGDSEISYVDSEGPIEDGAESRRASLVQRLSGRQKTRLESLEAKCKQVLQVYQDQQVNEFAATSNAEALKKLEWVFLKLLVAQHHLKRGRQE